MNTTVFSLEPPGSRRVIKEWIYPHYQRPAGGRPPELVLGYIEQNVDTVSGVELLEREYDEEGWRLATDGTRLREKRGDL